KDAYLAFAADMDVRDFAQDYASVNVPFALGYTYQHDFAGKLDAWSVEPALFSPPFFAGVALAGVKYLSSPRDSLGREIGLALVWTATNPGWPGDVAFNDATNAPQLYRYLSASLDASKGDGLCTTGNP